MRLPAARRASDVDRGVFVIRADEIAGYELAVRVENVEPGDLSCDVVRR